ncbi:phage regulatory CII family protein [Aeromonas allosaccharophila]
MAQITETTTLSKPMVSRSDVLVAAYLLGKSHNISKLARLMGKGETVLANKLNPECDSHHLNLGEAVAVTELTDDNAILEAWAVSRNKVLVDLPIGVVSDDDLVEQVLLAQAVFGKLMQAIHDARVDGVIDRIEQGQIERIGTQAAEHVLGLIRSTGANVRALPTGQSGGGASEPQAVCKVGNMYPLQRTSTPVGKDGVPHLPQGRDREYLPCASRVSGGTRRRA